MAQADAHKVLNFEDPDAEDGLDDDYRHLFQSKGTFPYKVTDTTNDHEQLEATIDFVDLSETLSHKLMANSVDNL